MLDKSAYPVHLQIFVLGTEKLGRHTRRGSALLVMGVGGGAVLSVLMFDHTTPWSDSTRLQPTYSGGDRYRSYHSYFLRGANCWL